MRQCTCVLCHSNFDQYVFVSVFVLVSKHNILFQMLLQICVLSFLFVLFAQLCLIKFFARHFDGEKNKSVKVSTNYTFSLSYDTFSIVKFFIFGRLVLSTHFQLLTERRPLRPVCFKCGTHYK